MVFSTARAPRATLAELALAFGRQKVTLIYLETEKPHQRGSCNCIRMQTNMPQRVGATSAHSLEYPLGYNLENKVASLKTCTDVIFQSLDVSN